MLAHIQRSATKLKAGTDPRARVGTGSLQGTGWQRQRWSSGQRQSGVKAPWLIKRRNHWFQAVTQEKSSLKRSVWINRFSAEEDRGYRLHLVQPQTKRGSLPVGDARIAHQSERVRQMMMMEPSIKSSSLPPSICCSVSPVATALNCSALPSTTALWELLSCTTVWGGIKHCNAAVCNETPGPTMRRVRSSDLYQNTIFLNVFTGSDALLVWLQGYE